MSKERIAELQYEAGMYKSLYEAAIARSSEKPQTPIDRETIAAMLYMTRWSNQTWSSASLWETELAYKQADAIIAALSLSSEGMAEAKELFADATKIDLAAAVKHIRNWTSYIDDHHRQKYADLLEAQAKLIAYLVSRPHRQDHT